MIEKIRCILSNMKEIDGWKIREQRTESSELFFIKKELDMNRGKNVHHFQVTVYKDFEENGAKYKGSSTTNISPTMNEEEINQKLESVAFAASFVKNQYYPLVTPSDEKPQKLKNEFSEAPIGEFMPTLTEAMFKPDIHEKGGLNSCELFLNKTMTRIINSEGVDVSFGSYKGDLEIVTNWTEDGEEVELFRITSFSDFKPEMISEEVDYMINISKERAVAQPISSLKDIPVLLTGEPVNKFFQYYYTLANSSYVYQQISTAKLNENIQGEDVKGDLVTMRLDPFMENSSNSRPYDCDGFLLKEITIYENGVLKNYWGDHRNASYLNIETTGNIQNFVVEGGTKSVESFKAKPYLELIAFSDFQMDSITGDFGGEIRLGRYFDGNKIIPVTGGSITGNIKEVHKEMYLSKELQQDNDFIGPKTIQLFNVSIAGN